MSVSSSDNTLAMLKKLLKNHRSQMAERDIHHFWKAFHGSSLNLSHFDVMKKIIQNYFPYFKVTLVPTSSSIGLVTGEDISKKSPKVEEGLGGSTKQHNTRFISLRDSKEIARAEVVSDSSRLASLINELISKHFPNGLYFSQISTRLLEIFRVIPDPSIMPFANLLYFIKDSCKKELSIVQSSPKYDPVVLKRQVLSFFFLLILVFFMFRFSRHLAMCEILSRKKWMGMTNETRWECL